MTADQPATVTAWTAVDTRTVEFAVERLSRRFAEVGRAADSSATAIRCLHLDLLRMQQDGLNAARRSRMRAQYRAKTSRRNRR